MMLPVYTVTHTFVSMDICNVQKNSIIWFGISLIRQFIKIVKTTLWLSIFENLLDCLTNYFESI
jgi:hypothetical protein